jgi:hypothetical protein
MIWAKPSGKQNGRIHMLAAARINALAGPDTKTMAMQDFIAQRPSARLTQIQPGVPLKTLLDLSQQRHGGRGPAPCDCNAGRDASNSLLAPDGPSFHQADADTGSKKSGLQVRKMTL